MFGDNSKELLGLTLNYNKPPKASFAAPICRRDKLDLVLPIEVTPTEVKRRLDAREQLSLIDVRDPQEHQICRIEGAELIPMRDIPQQLDRLEEAHLPLIVYCHHGVRSLTVVSWLREQGLTECQSMAGGIDAWSREVDPAVPRY